MNKPTIELEAGRGYLRWVCDICGETQEKDGMLSRVVFLADSIGMRLDYDICRNCLEAGVEGATERSVKRAEYLEVLAQSHREAIPNVLRMVSEWKTGKDYDAVCEEFEKQFREENEEEDKEFPF